ncbi:tRNA-guanine transglycosylase DpdA [Lacunisphaera limnophila]|nr:tRNA-guanine transglycosylase DpdA [Lacunisphaera limnophila]
MQFYLPDAQDLVDPNFDFVREERATDRMRQRTDAYAHELFKRPPYDGMLVSKAIVKTRYTLAQQQRLLRLGVRKFLRLDETAGSKDMKVIGDCGAFSYRDDPEPPYTVEEVVHFYDQCGFTYGISVDHVILAFRSEWDKPKARKQDPAAAEAHRRRELTLDLAAQFWKRSKGCSFSPMGVAQGWSPDSYADSVTKLQKMGYDYIAMGGLVPLKTTEILQVMERVSEVRKNTTKFHLLGVTRLEKIFDFSRYGAASFDSTAPLLQAFKSAKDNYQTSKENFIALRIPQVDANAKLKARILAGEVNQTAAIKLERSSLAALRAYASTEVALDETLKLLMDYTVMYDEDIQGNPLKIKAREQEYRHTLANRPWEACPCDICKKIGYDVIVFRGAERNRRRGFHNLDTFYRKLLATDRGLRK